MRCIFYHSCIPKNSRDCDFSWITSLIAICYSMVIDFYLIPRRKNLIIVKSKGEFTKIKFWRIHSYCKLTTSFSLSLRLLLNMPSDYSFYIWNTLFLSVSLRLTLFSTLFIGAISICVFVKSLPQILTLTKI
jgi:hypothetical protein